MNISKKIFLYLIASIFISNIYGGTGSAKFINSTKYMRLKISVIMPHSGQPLITKTFTLKPGETKTINNVNTGTLEASSVGNMTVKVYNDAVNSNKYRGKFEFTTAVMVSSGKQTNIKFSYKNTKNASGKIIKRHLKRHATRDEFIQDETDTINVN